MANITLENEKLSANELVLLKQLAERLNKECTLEDRTQSDIRLAINYCMENRMREQKGK
jgi:hypothetical protein